jgi:hypothetical protein
MDFGIAKVVTVATLLWVLGTSAGPNSTYNGQQPPPPPQIVLMTANSLLRLLFCAR